MKKVIVESPYAGDVERNERYAQECLADSLDRGEAPFASHLMYTHPGVLDDTKSEERKKGMEAGFVWGEVSDFVAVYTDLGISPGMQKGIQRHRDNGLIVEYRSIYNSHHEK